jgi:hypothetical protein
LNLQDVKNDPAVRKVLCRNFIVGESAPDFLPEAVRPAVSAPVVPAEVPASQPPAPPTPAFVAPAPIPAKPVPAPVVPAPVVIHPPVAPVAEKVVEIPVMEKVKPVEANKIDQKIPVENKPVPQQTAKKAESSVPSGKPANVPAAVPVRKPQAVRAQPLEESPKVEEKGKTVFEEVGDWLVNRFKGYGKRIKGIIIAMAIAAVLFMVIDIFAHITPFGKAVYSRLYPPDVVLTTVPPGARVSMQSRAGKIILSNENSDIPIELRKILPQTYIVTATKEGFKTVERVLKIEDMGKSRSEQRIEIFFDFPVVVNSKPQGAEVYIDGNKFKTAPWKGELTAGEHTVKLTYPGFEELGSLAKETKEGQCNIDFTKARENDVFVGVDQKYWTCSVSNTAGEKVFNITGNLYKRFNITSNPKNMVVHFENETKPRGPTPLSVLLTSGEYRIRIMDPEGRYEETSRLLNVDKDAKADISVSLNKWVTFKITTKDRTDKPVKTSVKITGNAMNISKEVSNSRPLRLALPLGAYQVHFESNGEYKSLTLKNVNIEEQTTVTGELEPANAPVKLVIKNEVTGDPIANAYIWLQNRIAGTSDASGEWKSDLKVGKSVFRIVAKGYLEKTMERTFEAGQKETIDVALAPEIVEVSTAAVSAIPPVTPRQGIFAPSAANPSKPNAFSSFLTAPAAPASSTQPKKAAVANDTKEAVSNVTGAKAENSNKQIIICPNCKKEYIVGPKKLRFCTNCGKPFR